MFSSSLVIPCYNAERTLAAVLAGVRRQSLAPDELLVVDDGSDDGSAETARRHGAQVVSHGRNRGLAAARNTGLERARGELVLFVDSDAVPHPDLVRRLTAGFDDPRLAAVGGQLLEVGHRGNVADLWRALFWRQTQGPRPLDDAGFVVGACCSLRRSAALRMGGFSRAFRTNGEDVEISVRLRQKGLRLAYDPRAVVFHLRHDTPRSLAAMVHRHSRDHVLALRLGGCSAAPVIHNALRWGPVTFASSLRRHGSLRLAGLSLWCHGASLAGCIAGQVGSVDPPG